MVIKILFENFTELTVFWIFSWSTEEFGNTIPVNKIAGTSPSASITSVPSTNNDPHLQSRKPRLPQRFGRLARRMDELFRGYRFRRTVTYWISRVRQCQQWALNGSAEQTHNCFNPLELRCIDLVTNINLIFDFPTTNVHSYFYFHPPTP